MVSKQHMSQQLVGCTFATLVLCSVFVPAVSFSMNAQAPADRAIGKPMRESQQNIVNRIDTSNHKQSVLKQKPSSDGFQWGNWMGMAMKLLVGGPKGGVADKMDPISQMLTTGEFSWTKVISLGVQLILSIFGNDDVATEKIDNESPLVALIEAGIAYFTGSTDRQEISVMAKQATELWGIISNLLDTLRTSYSKRSLEARSMGGNDLMADAAVASISMVKSYIKGFNTDDDLCLQKYVCEANKECAEGTGDSGYLFCQMGTYATSYILEGRSYTPFEIINDAGRRGRIGEDCAKIFSDCMETYF